MARPPELASEGEFIRWAQASLPALSGVVLAADSNLHDHLDAYSRYVLVQAVELLVGCSFPEPLIESLETVSDLYYFADVRADHLNSYGPPRD